MKPIDPSPRAVIFDMDGTLADTFPLVVAAWNAALSRHAGRQYAAEEVIARFGVPDSAMIRREIPEQFGDEAVEVYHRHYESQHRGLARPFEGVTEMLAAIRNRGLPSGVMTGKGKRSATITLAALGWDGCAEHGCAEHGCAEHGGAERRMFDAVVTGEDVTHQKPDPEGLLLVAKQLGVAPADCVFVGDSPADIGAGKNAGMRTIVAGWHPVYLEQLRAMGFDYWAQTPADVVTLLGASSH